MRPDLAPSGSFDLALDGQPCHLARAGAAPTPLDARRWHADASPSDGRLLDGCHGPTVDLGCGPGRLVAALGTRGVPALGVDSSARAVEQCLRRGAVALRRDVFDPLPGEGLWRHALLADGNIGIGGDPVALLGRVGRLLARDGSVLVELSPADRGMWSGSARCVRPGGPRGPWFPWATVGTDALGDVTTSAGLRLRRTVRADGRTFAELRSRW